VSVGEVRGHERIQAFLSRGLASGRVPPSLLLSGPEGVGKKALALAFARALLCERAPAAVACGECRTCRRTGSALQPAKLDALRAEADRHPEEDVWRNFRVHPDLLLAEGWRLTKTGRPRPEAEIRVGQVRDLIGEIAGAPFEARRRVFVIDDAHTMNEAAQNALLKSLEEPPPRSHVLLVTASPQGLRQTIRSRCQLVRFGPLPRATIEALLLERGELAPQEARLRAGLAGGSMAVALAFESEAYRRAREVALGLLERLDDLPPLARLTAAEQLEQAGEAALLLTTLRSLLRDVAALRAAGGTAEVANADLRGRLAPLAEGPLGARAGALAERVGRARSALRGFANRLLTFDGLVDALAAE
jgi:DNA polymerase-3 subunit delta'